MIASDGTNFPFHRRLEKRAGTCNSASTVAGLAGGDKPVACWRTDLCHDYFDADEGGFLSGICFYHFCHLDRLIVTLPD